ncbi:hypothetical protein K438DRAFT_1887965, partial [Mycena galopus ATCC 62051]
MSSPFASKLGTNYCPLDKEVLEIQALLGDPLSRLQSLDNRIAALQKAIDELAEERTTVKDYVDAHKALLSPIRRLPLDMLQEIFVACLPTHRNCVMSATECPVLLGRICSSWRTISLSTPRLWARLHIAEPVLADRRCLGIYEQKLAQRVEVATAWLERSGQCALSISLASNNLNILVAHSSTSTMIQALIPLASRWQRISMTAISTDLQSLSIITHNDVPMLKTLEMNEISGPRHILQWGSFGLLRGPNLSSFAYQGASDDPNVLRLRWDNLTSLSFLTQHPHNMPTDKAIGLLSRCPRLETCRLFVD